MSKISSVQPVLEIVETARRLFRQRLERVVAAGGLTREQYIRYLSMQYHLTHGVPKHFLAAASHAGMSGKRKLREFLFHFGLEEEPHYGMAHHDLKQLGAEPLSCPLDVSLWWTYFDSIIYERPFLRLGATCILENLGGTAPEVVKELFATSQFINKENSTFLVLHMHEVLPHGDQIIGALESVELDEQNVLDLTEGGKIGAVMYLRMADWALGESELMNAFFPNNDILA